MIVGVDEVGRGSWAGPLVAAAVLLKTRVYKLKDSKLLNRAQREKIALRIERKAHVGIGWVWPKEIDAIGLTAATQKAMQIAVEQIAVPYAEIIIDGNFNYLKDYKNSRTIIKADASVPEVSAASIIAKVARDKYMCEMALKFPNYQFDRHVGYGTRLHQELLDLYGACELHRQSYKPLRQLSLISL